MVYKIEVENKGFIGKKSYPDSGYCFVPHAYQAVIFQTMLRVIKDVFPVMDIPDDSCTIWRSCGSGLYYNYNNDPMPDNK